MKCIVLPEKFDYDGSQISSLWAYNSFGVQEDSVVVFRGACDVKIEHMKQRTKKIKDKRIGTRENISGFFHKRSFVIYLSSSIVSSSIVSSSIAY